MCFGRVFRHILFLVLLLAPWPALALPSINVHFAGNETFRISGKDLKDVGRIEVTVGYDSATLANPRLIPQSSFAGATVSLDSASGNTVQLSVTSAEPMTGSGLFATLAFDPVGPTFGTIRSVRARVYDANGKKLSARFSHTNPSPPLDPSDPENSRMIEEREARGESFMGGGVLYLPPEATLMEEEEQPEEPETADKSKQSVEADEAGAETGGTAAQQTAGTHENQPQGKKYELLGQSVLERFRLFKGERSPKNLMALFDADPAAPFKQTPRIVLADGDGIAQVTVSKVTPGKTPSFSFIAARYVSFKKVADTVWSVEAKPIVNTYKAGVLFFDDGRARQIPLTVAPKLRMDLIGSGQGSEEDFAHFLKTRGTAKAPQFDLNGDRKRDYVDDYIFTANYLVAREKEKAEKANPAASLQAAGERR